MQFLLLLHMTAGLVALVVAPMAMIVGKGGDWHRRWGKAFFYAMAIVVVTAIILGIARENLLMAMVAVFSFHMIASGYRALYLKRLHEGQRPARMDILIMGLAGAMNGGLFLWGATHLALGHRNSGPIIFLVFGLIGLVFVWRDLQRFFQRESDRREWLYAHMTGFLGGYIATVSAFSAVNLEMIRPLWLQWLWPTIVGAPLIVLWVRHYKRKLASGRRLRNELDIRIVGTTRHHRSERKRSGSSRRR